MGKSYPNENPLLSCIILTEDAPTRSLHNNRNQTPPAHGFPDLHLVYLRLRTSYHISLSNQTVLFFVGEI